MAVFTSDRASPNTRRLSFCSRSGDAGDGRLLEFGAAPEWLRLAWLAAVALVLHFLSKRSLADSFVLSIDERGIHDRRLLPSRIEWQEIEAICRVDTARNHVVDIRLPHPKFTLAHSRWPVRIGVYCQIGYGVPGLTIGSLLLDGSISEVLHAVAQFAALHKLLSPPVSQRTHASQVTATLSARRSVAQKPCNFGFDIPMAIPRTLGVSCGRTSASHE